MPSMIPSGMSASISGRWPESMNSFMTFLSPGLQTRPTRAARGAPLLHWIGQLADARHLDGDTVARRERTDAGRCAGRDDVPRQQRHHVRDVGDQLVDRKHQLRGRRRLPAHAVDPAFDADATARVVIDAGGDARANSRDRVVALRLRVAHPLRLELARRHVVEAREPEDVIAVSYTHLRAH